MLRKKIILLFMVSLFMILFFTCKKTSVNNLLSDNLPDSLLIDKRDGIEYKIVKIGNQWWMAENLNYGYMINSIETDKWHSDAQNNSIVEKYCLENNPCNCDTFGGIYEWNEAMRYNPDDSSGICPEGWHIPSDWEWFELLHFLDSTVTDTIEEGYLGNWEYGHVGTNSGNKLKENNKNGFNSKLHGYRYPSGKFITGTVEGYWSSTLTLNKKNAWMIFIGAYDSTAMHGESETAYGFCIRCIKDQ